ncbi:MAG: hypothetical protein HIU86_04865 [Acidobacteria bacterium]|nr:hypothetical protein [Acidobacteriota bacterium]
MRLPPVLDPELFSPAERSVLRLDGECVPLGLSAVPVDVPVDRVVRAASLASAVRRHGLVVDLRTAAWVHGAAPVLPQPLTLAIDVVSARRTKLVHPAPREVRFRPDDLERLGGVLVTTPLKTAFDLLRLAVDEDAETIATRLLRVAGLSSPIAAALAQLQPGCPHKQRGIDRLATLPCPPARSPSAPLVLV